MKFQNFTGICPAVDPRLIRDDAAQIAHNCHLLSGKIIPLHKNEKVQSVASKVQSVYKHNGNWILLDYDADFAESPVNEDKYKRLYYSGHPDGHLRMYGLFDGSNFSERRVFVPRPASAPMAESDLFWNVKKEEISFTPAWGFDNPRQVVPCSSMTENDGIWTLVFEVAESSTDTSGFIVSAATGSGTLKLGTESISLTDGAGELKIKKPDGETYATIQISLGSIQDNPQSIPDEGEMIFHAQHLELKMSIHYASSSSYRSYCYTFVDDIGQEGPPSAPSEIVSSYDGDTVTIQCFPKMENPDPDPENPDDGEIIIKPSSNKLYASRPVPPSTGRPDDGILNCDCFDGTIQKIRIYRTAGTETNADFFFLAELDYSTETEKLTYLDSSANAELSERLIRCENPPRNLSGLIACANGSLAACEGRNLYFCEPYQPNNWPVSYNYVTEYNIVGLAPSGSSVFALTEGVPEIFSGTHPEAMAQYKTSLKQACVSKKSICTANSQVFYASPDGIVTLASDTAASILTKNHFRRDQWQTLNPSGMVCAAHDDKLHIFSGKMCFIFDFANGLVLTTAFAYSNENGDPSDWSCETSVVKNSFEETVTDTLYLLTTSSIDSWCTGKSCRIATYRTKLLSFPVPINFSIARVLLETYSENSKFSLFDSNAMRHSRTVRNELGFRLPFLRREREWFAEVQNDSQINAMELDNSAEGLKG